MGITDEWKPWILNGSRLAREIVFTRRCLEGAAERLRRTPDQTRRWLVSRLEEAGEVTAGPPAELRGLKSPSGYFAVVGGVLALGLREDVNGTSRPVATRCSFVPDWLVREGLRAPLPDPFTLTGLDLVVHVEFSPHCLRRFQERCDGSPDARIAEGELRAALASSAQAVEHAPDWARSWYQLPDFYLVTANGSGFCLPMREYGETKAFLAATCLHRRMNPSDTAERPRGPARTIKLRCGGCGHETEVPRSRVWETPGPRCGGCGREMRVRRT